MRGAGHDRGAGPYGLLPAVISDLIGELNIHITPHRRDGAAEGFDGELGGLLAGGDEGVAGRDPGEESRDVGGPHHFQKRVGGIVLQAPHLAGGVVKRQAFGRAKRPDRRLVKTFFARHAEMLLVPEMDQPHDPPEVVDPVGVVERHAPPVRLRWEAAQKQDARPVWEKRLKGMLLSAHRTKNSCCRVACCCVSWYVTYCKSMYS